MSKKLTQKKIDSMFKWYVERQSVLYVSRKCRVSPTTVKKYRKVQEWDKRLKRVQQKAQEKQDESMSDSIAQNLKYVRFAKAKILEVITTSGMGTTNPMTDLDKAIRLELLLSGGEDSRSEIIIKLPEELKDI